MTPGELAKQNSYSRKFVKELQQQGKVIAVKEKMKVIEIGEEADNMKEWANTLNTLGASIDPSKLKKMLCVVVPNKKVKGPQDANPCKMEKSPCFGYEREDGEVVCFPLAAKQKFKAAPSQKIL